MSDWVIAIIVFAAVFFGAVISLAPIYRDLERYEEKERNRK